MRQGKESPSWLSLCARKEKSWAFLSPSPDAVTNIRRLRSEPGAQSAGELPGNLSCSNILGTGMCSSFVFVFLNWNQYFLLRTKKASSADVANVDYLDRSIYKIKIIHINSVQLVFSYFHFLVSPFTVQFYFLVSGK